AQGANQLEDLNAGEATDLRGAGAGSVCRIDTVDIESDVDGSMAKGGEMPLNAGQASFVKVLGCDHLHFVRRRKIEIVFAVNLTAKADLQDPAIEQEPLFKGAAERRAMRVLAAEILVPQIVVRVELDERKRAVFFCDGTQNREADGMVPAHTNTTHTGIEKRSNSLLNAEKSVFDGKRIHWEVAEIGDAVLLKRIHVKDGIPRANDRGLREDISWPEARAGAIRRAAIERNADESDLQFFGLSDVRQTHESGDAGEAGEGEGVKRLRVRQAKCPAGLRHGEAC